MDIDGGIWDRGPEGERKLRNVFSWLTRTGIGRKFGSLPISWYQAHQVCAIEALEKRAGVGKFEPFEVKTKGKYPYGVVYVRRRDARDWKQAGTVRDLFEEADRCARKG